MRAGFSFFQSKRTFYIFFFLLALVIGIHARLYPLLQFKNGDTKEKATLLVLAQLRSQIAGQIENANPTLPAKEKTILEHKMFQELLQKQGPRIRQTIERVSNNIQQKNPTERTYPYLLASDSFHFYNLTDNVVRTGAISDTFKGSKYLNHLMMAPNGFWEPISLHPYVGFLVYKICSLFKAHIPLDYAVSFTPLFLTALCLFLFYWIAWRLGAHPAVAFTASVFFLFSPIFVKRSMFGWYDNDPYNIFFPLLLYMLFWRGLRARETRSAVLFGFLLALVVFVYALFWQGWVFFFSLIFGSYVVLLPVNHFLLKRESTKNIFWQMLTFAGGLFLLISVCFGPGEFVRLFVEGGSALENFLQPKLSAWPDLYISVSELHRATWGQLTGLLGNILFLALTALGCVAGILVLFRPKNSLHPFYPLTLLIWLGISFYLGLGAQRFALLSFVPATLFCLGGLHFLFNTIRGLLEKYAPQKIRAPLLGLFIGLFLFCAASPIISTTKELEGLLNPIYNDVWDKALKTIAKKTPPDAIINTWWAPGHFIKATARRRVTFDGATINTPQAYWMSNVFMSQSEVEAAGILRMLDTSGNKAAETLIQAGLKTSEAVDLLKTVVRLNKTEARLLLRTTLKDNALAEKVLALTHGTPPPSYLLIFNEIVEKNIQFQFIGNWNFKAIEAINANPALAAKVPPKNTPAYIEFLWKLAGGPWRSSPALTEVLQNENFIVFEQNIKLYRKTKDCLIDSATYGRGVPQSIFYLQDGKIVEKKYLDANLPYSVVDVQDGRKELLYLMDRPLANSLLMRLHYFNGAGLTYFQPFLHDTDLTKRTDIHVFKINWDKFLRDQGENQ